MLVVPMLCVAPLAALAAGEATPGEAKAMAIKAVEYLKSVGPEKAFADFDAKGGPWHDRDLYVAVLDSQGMLLAHGNNPGLIGKSMLGLKDVSGRAFIREVLTIKDAGWIDYKWQNPVTSAVESKTTYYIKTGDLFVGVGAYAK